ncbi:hypothetical protein [Alphaproteobacteria bacterium endosymbiont of Tiliacea citrago]|uniref:hypothetical protein n=1 Tax=Alphaproteobacteria bacterium endosymbiont of Tiliacea citrago TaxID=3077944 RepID=UPI00313C8497
MKNNLKLSLLSLAFINLNAEDFGKENVIKKAQEAYDNLGAKKASEGTFDQVTWMALANLLAKDSNLSIEEGVASKADSFVWDKSKHTVFFSGKKANDQNGVIDLTSSHCGFKASDFKTNTKTALDSIKIKKSNKKYWIIGGVVALVVVAGVGYYFYSQNQSVSINL